ncbi:YhcN/YlaJ family sporulation lipoprotein [Bacillaceae bacterium IKA-2]|nr:YhcN/YlaJ family sporulation lipoprotein [Bacillaceae bacterium IKA-2]
MKLLHICIYTLIFSLFLGCQVNTVEEGDQKQQSLRIAEQAEGPRSNENKSGQEIAEHLVHLAERVPEVQSATALVLGDLVAIAIDVNAQLDRSDVGVVKFEVAEALKDDPHGAYAFVSADPDFRTRLQEMRQEIQAGHPVIGIMDELAAIVGRLIPIVPGQEHEKAEPEPTNANEEKLGEKQEDQLENVQEEQGKRDMEIED